MPRPGRELERLVAILEEALGPEGSVVVSPDRIPDMVTGRLREVDVAVRLHSNGPVVAICECRDRRGVADVTWVEQVVTKAHDLEGAPTAILVSSSGFTPQARRKADSYGHGVRLVSDVNAEEFRSWFRAQHVEMILEDRKLHGCEIRLFPASDEDFAEETEAAIQEHGLNAAIFHRKTLPSLTPYQLFEEWYRGKQEQIQKDVPANGVPVRRRVPLRFSQPDESIFVDAAGGRRAVGEVILLVEIIRESRSIPVSRATRYAMEDRELAQSIEFQLGEGFGTISAHSLTTRPTLIRYRPPEG